MEQQIDRGRHFLTTGKEGRADETLREHDAICAAIADRDFERAIQALHFHLDTGQRLMAELIEQRDTQEAARASSDQER